VALALLARLWPVFKPGRRGLRGAMHWADMASLVAFAGIAVVMLVTLDDYGLTYDEEPHIRYGERILQFYASGFHGGNGLTRSPYGGGFDLCAALLRRISPWDEYRTNHLLCAFVAQIGLFGTWKLGRLIGGASAGLLSLAFLILTPVYYGHQFNNPKDIPFAVGYVWGLYCIALLLLERDDIELAQNKGWRFWLALAVALGLAMSVRVGGAILVAYLFLFLVLLGCDRWRVAGRSAALPLGPVLLRAAASAFGGWLLMLAFWPRALKDPVAGPAAALETVSRYTAYDSPTLLRGQEISSNHVPWDYLPTYFLVQLPEFTSACVVLACVLLCVRSWRCIRGRMLVPWGCWLLVIAVAVPPAYAIFKGSTLYNGLRHFLFIIPPLCVLAGTGVSACTRSLARHKPIWAGALFALFGLFVVDQLAALKRLHPHEHVFFNRASGGLKPAVRRYETEYYGSVYKELNAQLLQRVWQERRADYLNTTFQVAGCGSKLFFTRNLPLNFQYQVMRFAQTADFYATYARDRCLERFRDRPVLTQIEREGAVIGVARDLKRKIKRVARAGATVPP
jgi:dolichyl-phosphate-mannose-protein mannosyltransferase